MNRPIALLTDFGTRDHYVGSLKAVILKINAKAVIFDITHEVKPQNIREGAFILNSVYPLLPEHSIVVAVVDPGVGSMRQAVCVKTKSGYLIGPNNGIFSLALADEKNFETRVIQNDRYFHKPVSATFHGRDIFAPAAAWLSKKNVFRSFGPVIHKIHRLCLSDVVQSHRFVKGSVVHIDRFGNAITNILRAKVRPLQSSKVLNILVQGRFKAELKPSFSIGKRGALIALWNSGDLLELAVREDSAEKMYGLKLGDSVSIQFHRSR
ncbi:MAG: SAM-dependent chlorinase/fluorinase [Candidatus Omnitrophica bacterium]|nr:SAM-dependent chlorinase/fluorinase [Candidatus Omnitrophota bacterium]